MLNQCQDCLRHVKTVPCPFCGGTQQAAFVESPVRSGRLRRAHLIAGAAVFGAVSVASCSTPLYGAPGDDDDETTDTRSDSTEKDAGEDG